MWIHIYILDGAITVNSVLVLLSNLYAVALEVKK